MTKCAVFLLGLVLLIGTCAIAFLVWFLWSLYFDIYDHLTGRWKRIRHTRIDSNYERGQFSVPYSQRDCK